jgi:hypothetical protein
MLVAIFSFSGGLNMPKIRACIVTYSQPSKLVSVQLQMQGLGGGGAQTILLVAFGPVVAVCSQSVQRADHTEPVMSMFIVCADIWMTMLQWTQSAASCVRCVQACTGGRTRHAPR